MQFVLKELEELRFILVWEFDYMWFSCVRHIAV